MHQIGEKLIFTKTYAEFNRNDMVEVIDNNNGLYSLMRDNGTIEKLHQKSVHTVTIRYRMLFGKNKLVYDTIGILPDEKQDLL